MNKLRFSSRTKLLTLSLLEFLFTPDRDTGGDSRNPRSLVPWQPVPEAFSGLGGISVVERVNYRISILRSSVTCFNAVVDPIGHTCACKSLMEVLFLYKLGYLSTLGNQATQILLNTGTHTKV